MVFIRGKKADNLFEKNDVAVPLLLHKGERTTLGIIGQSREVESARRVAVVVKTATAQVRNVNAAFDEVLAGGIGKHLHQLRMIFRPQIIGLRTAAELRLLAEEVMPRVADLGVTAASV